MTPEEVPGYDEAMDAALNSDWQNGDTGQDIIMGAVDAAIPIIIESLARDAETGQFDPAQYWLDADRLMVAKWLRSHLRSGEQITKRMG
jgi:hypothetical protein